jgi:hypothetical protein
MILAAPNDVAGRGQAARLAIATAMLALLFVFFANLAAQASVDIQKVRSKSDVEAWLVEDY